MAAFDYLGTAQEARTALMDAGALCVLTWTPAAASDSPNAANPDPVSVTAYGAIFDYGFQQVGTQPDSLIKAGDRQFYLAAFDETTGEPLAPPPEEATVYAPDGVTYVVKNCKPLAPAGVPVLFDINLRR